MSNECCKQNKSNSLRGPKDVLVPVCARVLMCPTLLQCAEQVWSWTIGEKNTELKIKADHMPCYLLVQNLMILPRLVWESTSQIGANYALYCLPYELNISSSVLYSVGNSLEPLLQGCDTPTGSEMQNC